MSRWDSAAMVPNNSELLPDPDTPVNAVSRRFGISTLMSFRLFTRAPWTVIRSWLSAACPAVFAGDVFAVRLVVFFGARLVVFFGVVVAMRSWISRGGWERVGQAC